MQDVDSWERSFEFVPASSNARTASEHRQADRILIVDDESSNRSVISLTLTSAGLYCEEAADGPCALEMLHDHPFDLVLLDVDMPRMRGTEVLRRLRETVTWPHLKTIMISGRTTPDELAQLMLAGADDYIAKPFTRMQLQARVISALRLKTAQDQSDLLQVNLLGKNRELRNHLQARDSNLVQARSGLVVALAELVSCRDHETGDHLMRLQKYSRLLATAAAKLSAFAGQIDADFVQMVECCAPLHDIGKAGVPDHILLKPGKLTADEFEVMKTHTLIGADILRKVAKQHGFAEDFLRMAADITRHHHERFDGLGYPDGLAGNAIPLAARIVTIADVYDAMRSRRVYKPAMPHAEVVRIITHESAGHFDPALLQSFQECAPAFEKLFDELTTG